MSREFTGSEYDEDYAREGIKLLPFASNFVGFEKSESRNYGQGIVAKIRKAMGTESDAAKKCVAGYRYQTWIWSLVERIEGYRESHRKTICKIW